MCIGIPMQIRSLEPGYAVCEGLGETRHVDMSLLGEQAIGTWLLVFIDVAREVLDEVRAQQITQAVKAIAMAANGESVDLMFADLINREPELPAHLRKP